MQYLKNGRPRHNETQEHVDDLLAFRERSRNYPEKYRDRKLSDPEFLEALELITKSNHPYVVATDGWELSPFLPFNGDPLSLGEQWGISRRQAADNLWKIEHNEPIEAWECAFIRFECAVQKESANDTESEIRQINESHKLYIAITLVFIAVYFGSPLLSKTLGSNLQIGAVFLYLFPAAAYVGEIWKLYKSINKRKQISQYLHEIRSLTAKTNCQEACN